MGTPIDKKQLLLSDAYWYEEAAEEHQAKADEYRKKARECRERAKEL